MCWPEATSPACTPTSTTLVMARRDISRMYRHISDSCADRSKFISWGVLTGFFLDQPVKQNNKHQKHNLHVWYFFLQSNHHAVDGATTLCVTHTAPDPTPREHVASATKTLILHLAPTRRVHVSSILNHVPRCEGSSTKGWTCACEEEQINNYVISISGRSSHIFTCSIFCRWRPVH